MPKTPYTPHRSRQEKTSKKVCKKDTKSNKTHRDRQKEETVHVYVDRRCEFEKEYVIIGDVVFDGGSVNPYRPSLMDHGQFPSKFSINNDCKRRLVQAKFIEIHGQSSECDAGMFKDDVEEEISYPYKTKKSECETTVILELMHPAECARAIGEEDENASDVVELYTDWGKLNAITDAIQRAVEYPTNIQYSYWVQTEEGLEDDDDKHCAAMSLHK